MPSSAIKLADEIFERKSRAERAKKIARRLTYLIVSYCLQITCAILVTLAVFWGIVQGMRVWNLFGISNMPPGIKYTPLD